MTGKNFNTTLIDVICETFPKKFEDILNIKQRGDVFRKRLLNFLDLDDKIGFGKVGVVGHSVFFKVYTAKTEYWTQMYDA